MTGTPPFDGLSEVAVIDCEATGLDPDNDRIISVGVALADLTVDDEHEIPTLETLVNPGVPIPPAATLVHGITDEDVADHAGFGEMAQKLRDFVGDRPLVGFNVSFDKRILNAELKRHGVKTFHRTRSHCVMRTLQDVWDYQPSLSNATARMLKGRARKDTHSSIRDALITTELAGMLHRYPPYVIDGAPGDRWTASTIGNDPPTEQQLRYIEDLGGDPLWPKTKRQASNLTDQLKSRTVGDRNGKPGKTGGSGCLVASILLATMLMFVWMV